MVNEIKEADIILIHDAVRPFVNQKLITELIENANKFGAVCPGIKPKSTIKEITMNNEVKQTINRDNLREIQTPQAFIKTLIIKAYTNARDINFFGTDSASLVEKINAKVTVIDGYEENIKITTPYDFNIAELLLAMK